MKQRDVSASAPEQGEVEAVLAVLKLYEQLPGEVPGQAADGVEIRVPPLVAHAMIVLLNHARPAPASVLASEVGRSVEAVANALTRFVEGPGHAYVTKVHRRFALTSRGRFQAHRYVNRASERLQHDVFPVFEERDRRATGLTR